MKPQVVDTHAHLDMPHFSQDRAEVIARALDSGVSTIVTMGIDLASSREAVKLAEDHPQVLAAVGCHPHDAAGVRETDMDELARLAGSPRVVAVGETGLDFYRNRSPRQAQLQVLGWHLELADRLELPVVIHCRQAEKDMLSILGGWAASRRPAEHAPGVIHCFNGDADTARQYLDMGFFISLGGYIGYPSSLPLHQVIRGLPADRLVVETDCPFLPPQSHRGQRNEPAYLPLTVRLLAQIRHTSPEEVARQTTQNALRLFRRPAAG